MSEESIWNKKTISIIAVTWILSLVTTLVVINFVSPPIPKKSWHVVEIYSGTFLGSIEEPDFLYFEPTISVDNWRIVWRVYTNQTIPPEDVLFYFIISGSDSATGTYPRNHVTKEDFRSISGASFDKIERGVKYFVGSGEDLYLTVLGIKINWSVRVEEYY